MATGNRVSSSQSPNTGEENRALLSERYTFGPGNSLRILGSKSLDTGSLYWPPRIRCPRTGGLVEQTDLPTQGTLWAWSFVCVPWPGDTHPNADDADEGYGVGIVTLDGGASIPAVLVGRRKTWQVGERMQACELPFTVLNGSPQSILAFEAVAE